MRYIFFVFALLSQFFALGQDTKFNWGIALPKTGNDQKITIFGGGNPIYFVVTQNKPTGNSFTPTFFLEAFKANHDRIFVKEITPLPQFDVAGVAFLKGKVVLFTYGFDKEQSGDILIATSYDTDNQGGMKEELGLWPVDRMVNRGRFKITQSPNFENVLVAYEPTCRRGENEQIQLVLYNKHLTVHWQTTQTLPYEWKRGVNNDYLLNNQGTAFVVKRTVLKREDNNYSVISYDGKTLSHHPLQPGAGKNVVAINHIVSDDGSLVTAGYYTEDEKIRFGRTNYEGNFLFMVSADGTKVTGNYALPFDKKRKEQQLKYIYVVDGKCIIMGQYESVSSSLSADKNKAVKGEHDYRYFSGDICIDAIDLSGKKSFNSVVRRNLDSKNDYGISNGFFPAVKGENIYIIFNDETSRYDGKRISITFYDPLLPILATVKLTDGSVAPLTPLYNSGGVGGKNAEMRMRLEVFQKIDAAHYLLRGENNQLFKMGSIRFD